MKKIKDIIRKLFGSNQKKVEQVIPTKELFYYGNPLVFTITGIENNELIILMPEDNFEQWLPAFQDSPLMKQTKERTNLFIHERRLDFNKITSEKEIMDFDIKHGLNRILDVEVLQPDHYDPRCGFRIQLKHTLINDEKTYTVLPVLNINNQIVSLERLPRNNKSELYFLGRIDEDSIGCFKYRPAFLDSQTFNTRPITHHHISIGSMTLDEVKKTKSNPEIIIQPRVKHIVCPSIMIPSLYISSLRKGLDSILKDLNDRDENGYPTSKSIVAHIGLMSEEDYQDLETKRLSKHDD